MSPLPDTLTPDEGSTYMLVWWLNLQLKSFGLAAGRQQITSRLGEDLSYVIAFRHTNGHDRCLCVHMCVLLCKYICVCVCTRPCKQWQVFVCHRLQQHPVWKALGFSCQLHWRTAPTRSSMGGCTWRISAWHGVYQLDILPRWGGLGHMDVGKRTMPAHRSQSLYSLYSCNCLKYKTAILRTFWEVSMVTGVRHKTN